MSGGCFLTEFGHIKADRAKLRRSALVFELDESPVLMYNT